MATADDFLDSDSSAADDFLDDKPGQGSIAAAGNAFAREAVSGVGHALQGAAGAAEISGEYLGRFNPETGEANPFFTAPDRTAAQTLKAVQRNPLYQQGAEIVEGAKEAYPVEAQREGQFLTKAAGMTGAFLPLVASGPAAPVTIGLQSAGAHLGNDFDALKAQGMSDEEAAQKTLNRALASGGLQSTIFLALPKPLRAAGEKWLVEKFGTSAVKEFLAGRVALGAEGAVLGATSTLGENVVSDRPLTEGVASGAAGLGAMNLLLPPYFRGNGRNRPADVIEAELSAVAPEVKPPNSGIIPPERQLKAPAIELPGPGGLKNQSVLQSIAELDALLKDLPDQRRVERLPAEVTDAGLREVLPVDPTTDIRRAPVKLTADEFLDGPAKAPETIAISRTEPTSDSEGVKVEPSGTAPEPPQPERAVASQPAAAVTGADTLAGSTPAIPPTENVPVATTKGEAQASNVIEPPGQSVPRKGTEAETTTPEVSTTGRGSEQSAPASSILDSAQKAVEGRLNEIKREGRLRALGDPEVAMLRLAQGAIYVLKGAKNFGEWSAQMIQKFGKEIEPHLKDLWEQAKQIASGTHPTIGLSQHGVKTIANEELSASVRELVTAGYAKLTDDAARTVAAARITEAGGPLPASERLLASGFEAEPGKIQNAIAASIMRGLNAQEKAARARGNDAVADKLAERMVEVAQSSIERSPDAGQTLQSFKLFYEQFTPAAWLKKFQRDVVQVGVKRTEAAVNHPVEPSPSGVTAAVADAVANQVGKTNPKLGEVIGDMFGTRNPEARSRIETLAEHLERTGRAPKGKGKPVADKISQFYREEVAKFKKRYRIPEFDQATQRDILDRARKIDDLPVDSVQRREASLELLNHLRRLKGFEWWELPLDFWYANILSGPATHLKNISGNSASLGAEVAVQVLRSPTALPSIIEALGRALPRAAVEASNIMRTGHDTASRHGGKFDTHGSLEALNGTAGKVVLPWKLVGRALKAADVMFFYPLQEVKGAQLASRESGLPVFNGRRAADVRRVMGWAEEAWTKAVNQAKAEGLTGNLAKRRTYELLEQARPETLMDNARDFAFLGTFNNDPYGVLGAVQRGFENTARQVPVLKLVAPFTRIITNITNSGLNWTPVGSWRAARGQGLKLLVGRDGNTGKLYGKEITDPTAIGDLYARSAIGTVALGGLAMAAGQYVLDRNPQFMVTGSGPADPDQKKQLREAGWIPYSIKIGDRYYTYQDKTWAMPLGVVGHYLDAVRYRKLDQQDALNRAAFAMSSAVNVIVQSSWLQGLSAIFDQAGRDSVKNPLKALPNQALRTASSFAVPNALRQLDQLFDPSQYKADDIRAMMLAQLPFARRNNQPALNVFGEPVDVPMSKQFLSKVEGDGLTKILAERRLWPSVPVDPYLTPAQTYALAKYRGPLLRAELLSRYADIATLPQAEAQQLVSTLSRKVTVQAKKDLGLDTLSSIEKQVTKMEQR